MIAKITSINKVNKLDEKYDIEVSDNHNYCVSGVVVHNCRCVLHIDEQGTRAFSRNVAKKSNWLSEFTGKLPQLRRLKSPEGLTILDGELLIPDQPCEINAGTLNSLPEEAVRRQYHETGFAVFNCFDIIQYCGVSLTHKPFFERRRKADEVVSDLGSEWVVPVPYFNTKINLLNERTTLDKRGYYDYLVSKGAEGVMLKHKFGTYNIGTKGREFQKVKKKITRDMIISGFGLPTREYKGKFPNDFWLYWEDENGDKVDIEAIDRDKPSASDLVSQGWTPVTKFWYFEWVGNILLDVLPPDTLTKKMTENVVSIQDPLTHDLYMLETVQCGECKGITEEDAIMFSKDPNSFIGEVVEIECNGVYKETGKLRHPRFKMLRKDKDYSMCTWDNHLEG